ncbi:phage baseplate assembly protein V, partial [Yersinia enterocolitica]
TGGNYTTDGDVQAGNISLTGHHHIDSMSGDTSDAKA